MDKIEDKIREFRAKCKEDRWGGVSKKCKLTKEEMHQLEELISFAVMDRNGVLKGELKQQFENMLNSQNTDLTRDQLIDVIFTIDDKN
ncbi:hypothetical protein [Aquimarina sp. Aq78]|uniref:hypothetical protein n=1 Tax=Aquimarina sp. Aq78 TaxID=1191889 RepID=UPI000D105508|nr:hypothetical protein [Aquimarina sp. Aq78]